MDSRMGGLPLWMHQVTNKESVFNEKEPWVSVGLMEHQKVIRFRLHGSGQLILTGDSGSMNLEANRTEYTLRWLNGRPAHVAHWVVLEEFDSFDSSKLKQAQALWLQRGINILAQASSAGDERLKALQPPSSLRIVRAPAFESEEEASAFQAQLYKDYGLRSEKEESLVESSRGQFEIVRSDREKIDGVFHSLHLLTKDGSSFELSDVEFGEGYSFHGFENRTYRGHLFVTIDRFGTLAAINLVPLESMLLGLVPAEIYPRAPIEALKTQAVTARSEILNQLGRRHLADPYHLCDEQHCAVYKGLKAETPTTQEAVESTQKEILLDQKGKLIRAAYSAVCGGHTENNEHVWGGRALPYLRGKPDAFDPIPSPTTSLTEFLQLNNAGVCHSSAFGQDGRFRWVRRFSAENMNQLTQHLGIGPLVSLSVEARGVSGRATLLKLTGERSETLVHGELVIRRLFNMLPSSMFVIHSPDETNESWEFQGGGFGHGVGLCQMGAIARAENGQLYPQILAHYFEGTQIARLNER